MEETQDIKINGVSVVSIADYAKRRHLKVSFVQGTLIKGDDQNPKIEPVHTLNRTGMYSVEELDAAYLTRGSKGITLASMGYLHPAAKAEMESRILELISEKQAEFELRLEVEATLTESETELEQVKADLAVNKSNLENAAASLYRARQLIESGQKQYDELRDENESLREKLARYESGHHN